MLGLPLAFAQPLVLAALVLVPVIWWLLRLVPPRPQRIDFPPTRLLLELAPKDDTPARSPWWLTALRLLLVTLLILAMAGPVWNPPAALRTGSGPLVIVMDTGWAAAPAWEKRVARALDAIAGAETNNRAVAIVATGEPARDVVPLTPGEARDRLRALRPQAFTPERVAQAAPLERFFASRADGEILWIADDVGGTDAASFVAALSALAGTRPVTVVSGGTEGVRALVAAENSPNALSVKVLRTNLDTPPAGRIRALDLKGLVVGETDFAFEAGQGETEARFELPVEIRNEIARLEIVGEKSAAAVQLLDERWRRKTIGIVSGATSDTAQPLVAQTYFLARALEPFADLRVAEGTGPAEAIRKLIEDGVPIIVLADVGVVPAEARERLADWVDRGGTLIRFAGPRLAQGSDDLVPVTLRRGDRTLGGALSWEKPQALGPFPKESPFAEIPVAGDVTVRRQVLAEPDAALSERTWAVLADGTPLVTADRRERGLIVLFHVSADTNWSDLPISGTFVDMLRRIVAIASAQTRTGTTRPEETGAPQQTVAPNRILDGFGAFQPAGATIKPIPARYADRAVADHPAGYYGPNEGLVAVNVLSPADRLEPLPLAALRDARIESFASRDPLALLAPFLVGAVALALLDGLAVFFLGGGIARLFRRARPAAAALLVTLAALAVGGTGDAEAQTRLRQQPPSPVIDRAPASGPDAFALDATAKTRLAYVLTGNPEIDNVSRAGLEGLTRYLQLRTALEPAEPVGVDIGRDELAFFPILYWPIAPDAASPDAATLARIDAFMKGGGTVIFDTRDAYQSIPTPGGTTRGPSSDRLRIILTGLDIPELEPVPRDHVLTKSFYLLKDFPGRYTTGQMWIEALPIPNEDDPPRPARSGDNVSPVLITANDLAGAWAVTPGGEAMLPIEGDQRQRDFAYRVGVNIVMYALTGNYKTDQVHVPALLERLGQ